MQLNRGMVEGHNEKQAKNKDKWNLSSKDNRQVIRGGATKHREELAQNRVWPKNERMGVDVNVSNNLLFLYSI